MTQRAKTPLVTCLPYPEGGEPGSSLLVPLSAFRCIRFALTITSHVYPRVPPSLFTATLLLP